MTPGSMGNDIDNPMGETWQLSSRNEDTKHWSCRYDGGIRVNQLNRPCSPVTGISPQNAHGNSSDGPVNCERPHEHLNRHGSDSFVPVRWPGQCPCISLILFVLMRPQDREAGGTLRDSGNEGIPEP
jgi:hypothetical protein